MTVDPPLEFIVGEVRIDNPHPTSIVFYADGKEALRITRAGITSDPSIPVDEAAAAVLRALESQIRYLK